MENIKHEKIRAEMLLKLAGSLGTLLIPAEDDSAFTRDDPAYRGSWNRDVRGFWAHMAWTHLGVVLDDTQTRITE